MTPNAVAPSVDVSVVIPVFNAEQSLDELARRLICTLQDNYPVFEIILVDDCSRDNSWEVLVRLREQYGPQIRVIRLAVNSGQHSALLCGFEFARGQVIVTMDDDLQHAPEDVPVLVAAVHRGYDVAIAAYDEKRHGVFRNLAGAMIDAIQRRIFNLPRSFQLTSFRAIRREVIQEVIRMDVSFPFITAMILANTSRRANIPVRHYPRAHGVSNYSFARGLSLALNLIFHYSQYPAYFVAGLCAAAMLVSVVLGGSVLARTIVYGSTVPGWASTMVAVAFSSAATQLGLLVLVIYLSRILRQLTRVKSGFKIAEVHG